jgi:hypothetical protein
LGLDGFVYAVPIFDKSMDVGILAFRFYLAQGKNLAGPKAGK